MRHGYVAISPEEQGIIAEIFTRIAPGSAPQYITYEEHYTKPHVSRGAQPTSYSEARRA